MREKEDLNAKNWMRTSVPSFYISDCAWCQGVREGFGSKTVKTGANNDVLSVIEFPESRLCAISGQGYRIKFKKPERRVESQKKPHNKINYRQIPLSDPLRLIKLLHQCCFCINFAKLSIFSMSSFWNYNNNKIVFRKPGGRRRGENRVAEESRRWVACESVICRNADTIGRVSELCRASKS